MSFEHLSNCDSRNICILGSTGSVGTTALSLIAKSQHNVVALVAKTNLPLLATQASIFKPKIVAIQDVSLHKQLRSMISDDSIKVVAGDSGIVEAIDHKSEVVVNAITGLDGLLPSIHSLKKGGVLALANKESIVCGGNILFSIGKGKIIPVDSEHNAIFNLIDSRSGYSIKKYSITASGGPFYGKNKKGVLPDEAIKHPIWKMGKKISVDSANLMNKVLEVIECNILFDIPKSDIEILIHPQSIVHAALTYNDGMIVSVMYPPDMSIPLSNAIHWPFPNHFQCHEEKSLSDFADMSFASPDVLEFPALNLLHTDKYVTLNAANEIAVSAFLDKKISFLQIVEIITHVVEKHSCNSKPDSLDEIFDIDNEARIYSNEFIKVIV